MVCPRCNGHIEDTATFCGHCGHQLAPIRAAGPTIMEYVDERRSNPPERLTPPHQMRLDWSTAPTRSLTSRLPHLNGKQIAFLAIILVLLVGAISAGVSALMAQRADPATGVTGSVSFSDSQNGLTDTVTVTIPGLQPPASGTQYIAWLIDEQSEKTLSLGALKQGDQSFRLSFTAHNTNLVGSGNQILVTQEQGTPSAPGGKTLLSAHWPQMALVHIRHLLFSFPAAPKSTGLLVGLRAQARQLNSQAILLNHASGNAFATQCAAQSLLNLLEGQHGAHTQPDPKTCTLLNVTVNNDGFGLLGANSYIADVAAHAGLAATQKDATDLIKLHAHHIIIATDNVKGWATTIDQDAQDLLANPNNQAKVQEIVTLADHVLNGVDLDHNEHVDPVPGEAGVNTAYIHGQLMAQLSLAA